MKPRDGEKYFTLLTSETVFGGKAQPNSEMCMLINVTPEFQ